MCGLCGLVGHPEAGREVRLMTPRLSHRGPDHAGHWDGGRVALGHTRLSIVDLSPQGNQPMFSEGGDVVLVGNGEIYNHLDLRPALLEKGHRFVSGSDNEILLHLYEEDGPAFLPRLNGMFALALWDGRLERLLLARDRLGIKPLYYYAQDGLLVFASEIKALLACRLVRTGIDPAGLAQYLTLANTLGQATLHRDIRLVEPGQMVIFEAGRLRRERFWRPAFPSTWPEMDFPAACQAFAETAGRSVERHLMADVEVACYLSSGFDSTSVAALARRRLDQELAAFTGGFGLDGWYDETAGAAAVAQALGVRHTVVRMGPADLARDMDDLIYALDEPRLGPGSFSQYGVARTAAQRVRVILTGHGGDEFFGGYPVFKLLLLQRRFGQGLGPGLSEALRVRPAEWPHLVFFLLQAAGAEAKNLYLPVIFSRAMLAQGLQPRVWEALEPLRPEEDLEALLEGAEEPSQRLVLTYLRSYLPGLFLVEDKISSAHSLEARTPLCDNAMVDLALSLPLELKLHGGELKAIPKAAMRPLLPPLLYRLPKRGFPTPLAKWFRGELAEWVRGRLLAPAGPLTRLFKPDFLTRLVEGYLASWRRRLRPLDEIQTHRLWALLSLEAWLRVTEERSHRPLDLS